jgi:hypothetical protein
MVEVANPAAAAADPAEVADTPAADDVDSGKGPHWSKLCDLPKPKLINLPPDHQSPINIFLSENGVTVLMRLARDFIPAPVLNVRAVLPCVATAPQYEVLDCLHRDGFTFLREVVTRRGDEITSVLEECNTCGFQRVRK